MALLKCELCGGKLIGKPGGIFECDSCGMEYSAEWAKEKIQQIRGTVTVEGTVQIEGDVNVHGVATASSLVKRGMMELESKKWSDAKKCFDDACNIDPENSSVYFGLLLCELNYSNGIELSRSAQGFVGNDNFIKAIRYANKAQKDEYFEYAYNFANSLGDADSNRNIYEAIETYSLLGDYKDSFEKKRILEEHNLKIWSELEPYVRQAQKVDFVYTDGPEWSPMIAVLNIDGTVSTVGYPSDMTDRIKKWKNINSISFKSIFYGYGLKKDGTVVSANDDTIKHSVASLSNGFPLDKDGRLMLDEYNGKKFNVKNQTGFFYVDDSYGVKYGGILVNLVSGEQFDILNLDNIDFKDCWLCGLKQLRPDGTLICGDKRYKIPNIDSIVSIVSDLGKIFWILRKNGTVLRIPYSSSRSEDTSNWTDIVDLKMGLGFIAGLKKDGTIVIAATTFDIKNMANVQRVDAFRDSVSTWTNIGAIMPVSCYGILGVTRSGGIRTTFKDFSWFDYNLFSSISRIDEEREERFRRNQESMKQRETTITKEIEKLAQEKASTTGFFVESKKTRIDERIRRYEEELKELRNDLIQE